MRVLHVDPAPTWRGGERQVLLLATGLAREGIETLVAAAPEGPLAARAAGAGLAVEPFRARGDLDPAAIARGVALLRRVRPDVVHLHTARAHGAGGMAARLAGRGPIVVTRRVELPVRGPFGRWKYRRLADHYVAISSAVERALVAGGVPAERITRIPSGVPLPPQEPAAHRPPERPWTVGTLAAFTPQKDPATWTATVRKMLEDDPGVVFLWAGDGELRRATEVALSDAGLSGRVRLPGFLVDPEVFWRQIDVFFLPSAFEALGTVILDAMARGIPVVATRVGGIPEVIRDGRDGLLAAPGDGPGLAAALRRLRDPAEAARFAAAGRERVREFDVVRTVRSTRALYERLLGGEGA